MHQRGWHHHDLSGHNIVRDSNGKLAIVDFGLAVQGCAEGDECTVDTVC
jgi:tRNA A-37 threonylcarbamoyl transferase component Bud32